MKNKKGQVALEGLVVMLFIIIGIAIFYGRIGIEEGSIDKLYTVRVKAQQVATEVSLGESMIDPKYTPKYTTIIRIDPFYSGSSITSYMIYAISEDCSMLKSRLTSALGGIGFALTCGEPYQDESSYGTDLS